MKLLQFSRFLFSYLALATACGLASLLAETTVWADLDNFDQRWQRAHKQRAFPKEEIPPGARLRALEQLELERGKEAKAERGEGGGLPFQWINIGPSPLLDGTVPITGRVTVIAVDPADSNHWLIGAAQGGIWETWNAGTSWQPRTDDQASLAMGAIAFAPSQPRIIYAGTGEANFAFEAYAGAGLLKSLNRGTNWYLLAANRFEQAAFSDIKVHPSNPNTLVAATTRGVLGRVAAGTNLPPQAPPRGVFRSTSGGTNWTLTLAGEATDLEVDPGDFNRQYAALGEIFGHHTNGVYRSTGGGVSWTRIAGPWVGLLHPTNTGRIELAIAPSNPNRLYVSVARKRGASGDALLGIWQTDNAWNTTPSWTQITSVDNPDANVHLWYYHELIVHPENEDVLFFGELQIWKYNGVSWVNFQRNDVHVDYHAFAWQPQGMSYRLVLGSDGGVWSLNADGTGWMNHNEGLSITQFYEGSVHPADGKLILGGSQDNGTEKWTGLNAWEHIAGGDGSDNAISSSNPSQHWAMSSQNASIIRTKDGGGSVNAASFGIIKSNAPFITRFEKSTHNDDLFILGTTKIWKCTNFFTGSVASWQSNSPVLVQSSGEESTVTALAFAPSDTASLTYAYGTEDGQLRLTVNGGTNWMNLDPANDVPDRYVTDLAFHPTNANVLYLTLSGFDESTPGASGHVFKLTINGVSLNWDDISPPVNLPHNTIAVDPMLGDFVYVGTDIGVWQSLNAGQSWSHQGPSHGMPNIAVFELQVDSIGRLTAFTHGRGAFVYRPVKPDIFIETACPLPCQLGWVNPYDLVTIDFLVRSIIADARDLTVRVLPTSDVQPKSGAQKYGAVTAFGDPVKKSFTLQLGAVARAAGDGCGDTVDVILALDDAGVDLGTLRVPFRLGRPTEPLAEDFEHATLPDLPLNWRSANVGNGSPWTVTTNRPVNEVPRRSPPDAVSDLPRPGLIPPDTAASAPAPAFSSDNVLISPPFRVDTSSAQVTFRHAFEFQTGFDGGVLEISIDGAAFVDITRAFGSFADNGYNQLLVGSSALSGRMAWTGDSGGWIVSVARLPSDAAGQSVQLRWRCATDASVGGQGWFIGSVVVSEFMCLPPVTSAIIVRPRHLRASFAFDFETVRGRTYLAEFKEELDQSDWQLLRSILGDGNQQTVIDSLQAGQRFYRLRVE